MPQDYRRTMAPPTPAGFNWGGQRWAIELVDDESFKRDYRGRSFIESQQVKINADLPLQERRKTLLHELLHCVSGPVLGNEDDLNERQVRAVTHGLFDVLINNPEVTRFILGGGGSFGQGVNRLGATDGVEAVKVS